MLSRIKKLFLHSETIFLARVQIVLGLAVEVFIQMEPSLFSDLFGKWFPVFLIAHGMLVGYVRKRGDKELKDRGSKLPL